MRTIYTYICMYVYTHTLQVWLKLTKGNTIVITMGIQKAAIATMPFIKGLVRMILYIHAVSANDLCCTWLLLVAYYYLHFICLSNGFCRWLVGMIRGLANTNNLTCPLLVEHISYINHWLGSLYRLFRATSLDI